jgi:hypothetical protein
MTLFREVKPQQTNFQIISSGQSISWYVELIASYKTKTKLSGLSPRANYTDRATAAVGEVNANLFRYRDVAWSARRIPATVFSVL